MYLKQSCSGCKRIFRSALGINYGRPILDDIYRHVGLFINR